MAMYINEYSIGASSTALYPRKGEGAMEGLAYTALGLTGEAGEYAEKVKKFIRDGVFNRELALKELGDVLWYLNAAASELGSTLEEVAQINLNKLRDRQKRSMLQGNGDVR